MKNTAILIGIWGVVRSITGPVFAADAPFEQLAHEIRGTETIRQLEAAAPVLTQFDAQLQQMTATIAEQRRLQRRIEEQLRAHLTPQDMVLLFFREATRQGFSDLPAPTTLRKTAAILPNPSGGISGQVLVGGMPPGKDEVKVYAFDRHGYFCGASTVNEETGSYTITSLKSDSFYVFARSANYVDQIYDKVTAPLGSRETWRQAKKVFVPSAIVSGIDFNLQRGVTVTGSILSSEGWAIDDGTVVDFTITNDVDSTALLTGEAEISGGRYELLLPATGRFKIKAEAEGYAPSWAFDQPNWHRAQTVEVADLTAAPVVDFKLTALEQTPTGAISGTIKPGFFALLAVFDARTASLVRMGLAIGLLEVPYMLSDLPPGDYLVYADDLLGTLVGAGNSMGEFYDGQQGARTFGGAKPVSVVADLTTENIDFTLEPGTTVRGRITDATGAPLDSLTLLLVNADLLAADGEPFLTRLELDVVATEFDGRYEIPGLKPGRYLLRTFSDFFINFDLGNTDSLLLDGKHKGKVVDQYYGGEPNLLRIARAERLMVNGEEELSQVDFRLQPAYKISGRVTDDAGKPADELYVVALEDSSGYPFYPWATVDDSTGQYELRALPPGKYKLLALTGFSGNTELLSEFYGGGRSFYTAPVVDLTTPLLANINFTLEQGATIEGFVVGQDGKRLGADIGDRLPVVAYHAASGKVASYDFVQFNGGYRIRRLLPGDYKLATIPAVGAHAQCGVSYWGGGVSFDDANSQVIVLDYGVTMGDKDLHLTPATGRLEGVVADSTNTPLSGVFVGAYDLSGHLAGYALTDFDALSGKQIGSTGRYEISGLAPGEYYVRTVALFMAVPLIEDATAFIGGFENFDILGLLTGGGLGSFDINLPLYKDQWFEKAAATITLSLDELLFQLSAYGLPNSNNYALTPIYLPLPFYDAVPSAAQKVTVDDQGTTVNFMLTHGGLNDLVTETAQPSAPPAAFALHQNYPNPFNPGTKITFELPHDGLVELAIFDALGRRVAEPVRQVYTAGSHSVIWNGVADDGSTVAAGIYFARLTSGDFQKTIKLVLIK